MITLYRKNKLGIGTWRIWADGHTIYMAHATTMGGGEILHSEIVPRGLAGRTLTEQIDSRIRSRVNRQMDKGYVGTWEEASTKPLTNTLDLPVPMLAKKFDDLRYWPSTVAIQPKLDGFRCLITRNPYTEDVICYSRQGKILTALDHICEIFEPILIDDMVIDGEIYQHGMPLQTIASLAKRKQRGTEKLVYHAFDVISPDPYQDRLEDLTNVIKKIDSPNVNQVETSIITTPNDMWSKFADYRNAGYEGAIVRLVNGKYEPGTRSLSLLKVKAREDSEYPVIDVIEGSDGLGILVMETPQGKRFKSLAPGSHDQKRFILVHKDQYIGRYARIEYANLTADGIPFHGVCTAFRAIDL